MYVDLDTISSFTGKYRGMTAADRIIASLSLCTNHICVLNLIPTNVLTQTGQSGHTFTATSKSHFFMYHSLRFNSHFPSE